MKGLLRQDWNGEEPPCIEQNARRVILLCREVSLRSSAHDGPLEKHKLIPVKSKTARGSLFATVHFAMYLTPGIFLKSESWLHSVAP